MTLRGFGENARTVTGEHGGKQSQSEYTFRGIDPRELLELARIKRQGDFEYDDIDGVNWQKIPAVEHIDKALVHIFAHQAGDTQEDHLRHAIFRLIGAAAWERKQAEAAQADSLSDIPNPIMIDLRTPGIELCGEPFSCPEVFCTRAKGHDPDWHANDRFMWNAATWERIGA